MSAFNEYDPIERMALHHARHAFADAARVERDWRALNFTSPPDIALAVAQFDAFRAIVAGGRTHIDDLPAMDGLTLDAIYARDASVVSPRGLVLASMGKAARQREPEAQGRMFRALGLTVLGAIRAPGQLEGGDVVWFDDRTLAVGRGYRTNDDGIHQLQELVGRDVNVVVVDLPHYRGQSEVFHLMSIISPVDADLAVVYSPLMPVRFREWLLARGIRLVEVLDEEFETMGGNVLAIAPRECVMLDGNPVTRARLETAGARVSVYDGSEISIKGGGGPTCLARPLSRRASR